MKPYARGAPPDAGGGIGGGFFAHEVQMKSINRDARPGKGKASDPGFKPGGIFPVEALKMPLVQ